MIFLALAACGPREVPAALPPVHRRPIGALARAPDGLPDLTVDCNGGGDFLEIQDAIDAAADKSWIEVLPCHYQERIDFLGKTIWMSSTAGAAATRIDGQHNGTVVTVRHGEGDGTALVGFTIEDGDGYGVHVEMAALRLQDVIFDDNDGTYSVRSESGDLELVDVTIDDGNEGSNFQIHADRGSIHAKRVSVACGNGEGIFTGHNGYVLDAIDVECAGQVAYQNEHGVGRIQRSILVGTVDMLTEEDHFDDMIRFWNTVVDGDFTSQFGTLSLRNSVFTGQLHLLTVADTLAIENDVFTSALCPIDSDSVLGPIRNNDFVGGLSQCNAADVIGQDGNVSVAPMFVDPLNGDLHLQAVSPLVDAGVTESAYDDIDGSTSDLGIYGGHFSQDGGW